MFPLRSVINNRNIKYWYKNIQWGTQLQNDLGLPRHEQADPSPLIDYAGTWIGEWLGCRWERQRIPTPSGARESRSRKGSIETHVSRDPSPWPAGSMGCRRERPRIQKPSGTRESRARKGSVETHVSRDPSPWPAGSMGCQRERQRIPKPSGARESRARKGSVETTVSRDPSPWPAGSTGCRRGRLPSWCGFRTLYGTQGVSSDILRDSRCVGTDVHTHERGTHARRGKPCRRDVVFGRATRVKV